MLAVDINPVTWDGVKFQDATVKVLKQSIIKDQPIRSLLLVGPTGRGKTTIAKIYAASLVCSGDTKPCGICDNCRDIFEDKFYRSVQYVDGIIDNGVDYYREKLSSFLNHSSFFSDRKVIIVDEVHGLSKEALQTFLIPTESSKSQNVFFIFSTTESNKVKDTLKTRCMDFCLKTPNELELAKFIITKIEELKIRVPQEFLAKGSFEIACASNGSVRAALRTLEKVVLSKDYSLENIHQLVSPDMGQDILQVVKKLVEGKQALAICDLETMFQEDDSTRVFNRLYKTTLDSYRLFRGISLSKPYYEGMIRGTLKDTAAVRGRLDLLLGVLTEVKKVCGYYVDRNIVIYRLINLNFEGVQ